MPDPIVFRLVLPPGWVHIKIDANADETVRELAHSLAADVDAPNRAKAETLVRDYLSGVVAQAKSGRGQDIYFPTQSVQGSPLPMSIVVSEAPLPSSAAAFSPTDALLSFAARSAGSQARTVDGELAVRSVSDVAGDGTSPDTRRVSYLVCTPSKPSRLMLVTSSILKIESEGTEELVDALEFLFDTMVTTIRFERESAIA